MTDNTDITQVVNAQVQQALTGVDVSALIKQCIMQSLLINREHAVDLYPGITDTSKNTQLSIMPNTVVIEHDLVTTTLEVVDNAKIKDLTVTGNLKVADDLLTSLAGQITQDVIDQLPHTLLDNVKAIIASQPPVAAASTAPQGSIQQLIEQQILATVTAEIPKMMADPNWLMSLNSLITQIISKQVASSLATINLSEIAQQALTLNREQVIDLIPGIQDQSTSKEMTLMPGIVVVENELVVKNLEVVENTRVSHMTVTGDLTVTGTINTDNSSWKDLAASISQTAQQQLADTWKTTMKNEIVNDIKTSGIEITSALIDGRPLFDNGTLTPQIQKSNLTSVGSLTELVVNGEAQIGPVHITSNRLGINTDSPEMALSIWDEEVSIVAGKKSQNQAFIGTSRNQNLVIGVNNNGCITVDVDGTTTINKLRVGRNQIGHTAVVPNWSGTKGDIMFNSNLGNDGIFGWICLGAFKWQTLKSAV
jgi:hypothetical protein